MNTRELYQILTSDIMVRRTGTYQVVAVNQLPAYIDPTKTAAFIINTDPSYKPGEHWVALFYNGTGQCEFFDSFGLAPRHPEIIHFIERHSTSPYIYNTHVLQQLISRACGLYAIYFILLKVRGRSMTNILRPFFSTQQWRNDRLVYRLVRPWLQSNFNLL